MNFEEEIKNKFGKNTVLIRLPDGGCLVDLHDKKLPILETTEKKKLSERMVLVPGKEVSGVMLYHKRAHRPFAAITSGTGGTFMILYEYKENTDLIKELLDIM